MRKVPQKRKKGNKFVSVLVIILIFVTIALASFIITFNVMSPGGNNIAENNGQNTEEYAQPDDMLNGNKSDDDKIKELRKENAELKKQVSDLEVENAQLRLELESITATLENQDFVQQNGSTTEEDDNDNSDIYTSENGL